MQICRMIKKRLAGIARRFLYAYFLFYFGVVKACVGPSFAFEQNLLTFLMLCVGKLCFAKKLELLLKHNCHVFV